MATLYLPVLEGVRGDDDTACLLVEFAHDAQSVRMDGIVGLHGVKDRGFRYLAWWAVSLQEIIDVAIGTHRLFVAGKGDAPPTDSRLTGQFVEHEAAWIHPAAEPFAKNSLPRPHRFPAILANDLASHRMDKPPVRERPGPAGYRSKKRLQVVRSPPVVIIKIGHVTSVGEVGEHGPQHTSVARRVQAAMSDGSRIARIEEIRRDIRWSAFQTLDQLGEGTFWCVHANEQLDPECSRLCKDRGNRIYCRSATHGWRYDRDVEWPRGVVSRSEDTPTMPELAE